MSFFKIPISAVPVRFMDILKTGTETDLAGLKQILLSDASGAELFFLNSGAAGFYTALCVLKEITGKTEVVLPAYTAGSLIVAIEKAGLKPVLCDISLADFNMDPTGIDTLINDRTMAIVMVHMFGIVQSGILDVRGKYPDICVLEDCAQAMGSSIDGIPVGSMGDISFYSFNKGKNIPAVSGGCVRINSDKYKNEFQRIIQRDFSGVLRKRSTLLLRIKMFALSIVVNRYIYGAVSDFLAGFRDMTPPGDIEVKSFSRYQAAVALSLLHRQEQFSSIRSENGRRIAQMLHDDDGIICPVLLADTVSAFNRYPVLFKDVNRMEKVRRALLKAGFETSRMYFKPLHRMFPELDILSGRLPNSEYLAEHLLVLPCHPMVKEKDIYNMGNVIISTT